MNVISCVCIFMNDCKPTGMSVGKQVCFYILFIYTNERTGKGG